MWMQLDLPEDVSRIELEDFAHHMVTRIHAGAGEASVATHIVELQLEQFCRHPNLPVIRELARRSMIAVRGA